MSLVLSGLILQRKGSQICRQVAMVQIKINKAKKCKAHYSNSLLPHQRVNKIAINFNFNSRTVNYSSEEN